MANINLLSGVPTPDQHFLNERYLPSHSSTIFEDGLYKSDFSPFIGRTGDRIDLSMHTGAAICQPSDIQRQAGNTNVITYMMARGMITEAVVNFRGQRLGLEEELWDDRAQVPLYTVEKYGSLGDWQGVMQTFHKEFLKVKPHLLAAYQRQVDWLYYRSLLYNEDAALSIVDSSGVVNLEDYFESTAGKFAPYHLENLRAISQITGLTAPNVYSKAGGKVRRAQFPILLMNLMVEDFSRDPDVLNIIESTAQGGSYDTAFERLVASYLTYDFYSVEMQNGGSTGHMGHPLWPIVVWSADVPDAGAGRLDGGGQWSGVIGTVAGGGTGGWDDGHYSSLGTESLAVGLDTKASSGRYYLEAALQTDWLRDFPQHEGCFWLPARISDVAFNADGTPGAGYTFDDKVLIKVKYETDTTATPAVAHDATTFYKVGMNAVPDKWPTDAALSPNFAETNFVRVDKGAILAAPYGMAMGLSSYAIIYAPSPGNAPRYVYEEQDYQTRHGVGLQGALYFGPRLTYQRSILGPIVMRFKMSYPYQIDGAKLYPKLTGGGKTVSYYGVKPYVGQTDGVDPGTYEKHGSAGDLEGDYVNPTDFDPGNTGETAPKP